MYIEKVHLGSKLGLRFFLTAEGMLCMLQRLARRTGRSLEV